MTELGERLEPKRREEMGRQALFNMRPAMRIDYIVFDGGTWLGGETKDERNC
jgi:hypothetical protein